MNRRDLLKISAAAGVSLGAFGLPSLAQAKQIASADGIEVLSVSDGNLRLPLSFIFPDVPEAELKALLDGNLVDGEFVEPGLNLTLMKNGDRTVLFDVGSGPNFMPSAGKLMDSLDAAGVASEDITDVVFTHAHPDHLWGILDDFDEVLFSEAVLHVPRREFKYWMDEETVEKTPDARKAFAVGAKNSQGPTVSTSLSQIRTLVRATTSDNCISKRPLLLVESIP